MDQNQYPAGMPAPEQFPGNTASAQPASSDCDTGSAPGAQPVATAPSASVQTSEEGPLPVWMQRTFLVIYVVFCLEIGMLLTILPWTEFWYNNPLLLGHMSAKALLSHNFVRGMISGVGLLDIWLGIWEAVHYHDHRTLPPVAP